MKSQIDAFPYDIQPSSIIVIVWSVTPTLFSSYVCATNPSVSIRILTWTSEGTFLTLRSLLRHWCALGVLTWNKFEGENITDEMQTQCLSLRYSQTWLEQVSVDVLNCTSHFIGAISLSNIFQVNQSRHHLTLCTWSGTPPAARVGLFRSLHPRSGRCVKSSSDSYWTD